MLKLFTSKAIRGGGIGKYYIHTLALYVYIVFAW